MRHLEDSPLCEISSRFSWRYLQCSLHAVINFILTVFFFTPSWADSVDGSFQNAVLAKLDAFTAFTAKIEGELSLIKSSEAEVKQQLSLIQYSSEHVLSKDANDLLDNGALFYVHDDISGPRFCGFFVHARVALTVHHDEIIINSNKSTTVKAVSSFAAGKKGKALEFSVHSKFEKSDFAVLVLKDDMENASFFPLVARSNDCFTGRTNIGLVTMNIGMNSQLGLNNNVSVPPSLSQYKVSIKSEDADHLYYEAETWSGDSGSALLIDNGTVIGMHIEIVDDKPLIPDMYVTSPPQAGTKRSRSELSRPPSKALEVSESFLGSVSQAASSHGKSCTALSLKSEEVHRAVEAAIQFVEQHEAAQSSTSMGATGEVQSTVQ